MTDIVESLRERAHFAREESTGTADGDAYHFDKAANEIERLRAALAPFASDKMPDLRRCKIDYNSDGLRCAMSPMEIACRDARLALALAERPNIEKIDGSQS